MSGETDETDKLKDFLETAAEIPEVPVPGEIFLGDFGAPQEISITRHTSKGTISSSQNRTEIANAGKVAGLDDSTIKRMK